MALVISLMATVMAIVIIAAVLSFAAVVEKIRHWRMRKKVSVPVKGAEIAASRKAEETEFLKNFDLAVKLRHPWAVKWMPANQGDLQNQRDPRFVYYITLMDGTIEAFSLTRQEMLQWVKSAPENFDGKFRSEAWGFAKKGGVA